MHKISHHHPDLILEVSNALGIEDQGFVEKDLFVTQAIGIIHDLENEYFKPVFAGGTCLAKAHKIIHRISEDIDFKITTTDQGKALSNEKLKRELTAYHNAMLALLETNGLQVNQEALLAANDRKYFQVQLNYPSFYESSLTLRPHLLIELTVSNTRRTTHVLSINSMVGEYLQAPHPITLECISLVEAGAEKWVALTRKIAAIARGVYESDRNLVRHLYDLHAIDTQISLDRDFVDLTLEIIKQDAKQFRGQCPQYFQDPIGEIKNAINILRGQDYQKDYDRFVGRMVIGNNPVSYENAWECFEAMTRRVLLSAGL